MMSNLPKHMPALDGLRGLAILMVVLTHCWTGKVAARSIYEDTSLMPRSFVLPSWLDRIGSSAVHGVTLFFVVSAFTLTVRFASNREAALGGYALRRLARIGPAFWLAALCYALAVGLGPRYGAPQGLRAVDIARAALFGSAWGDGPANAVVPGGWSVSCEVAFYVALPVILWLTQYRLWRIVTLAVTLALGAQLLVRHDVVAYVHPAVQMPSFLCGVCAAVVAMRIRLPRHDRLAMALFATAVLGVPFSPVSGWFVQQHFQFAALAAIAIALVARHPPRLLASAPMRRIGEVSFSMYLLHFALLAPSLYVSERFFPADGWATFACHFVLTAATAFACACVTHRFIECPPMRWTAAFIHARADHRRPALSAGDNGQ